MAHHGLYSSKHVSMSTDTFGKQVTFNATLAPWFDPATAPKRDCYKGKQVLSKTHLPPFSKLEYAPETFDDSSRKGGDRKTGFGTSAALNRDDLSSTLEVSRFRNHLELEARNDVVPVAPTDEAAAATVRADAAAAQTQSLRATRGLASTLPTFTNEYDRQRHVAEFSTRKIAGAAKYERVLGTNTPVSYDIGEGASDAAILKSPERGVKKPNTHSIVHATVSMLVPTLT